MTKHEDAQARAAVGSPLEPTVRHHEWDDDGCCIYCGFDGAEWHWWKHSTYEGRAHPEARMPRCLTLDNIWERATARG